MAITERFGIGTKIAAGYIIIVLLAVISGLYGIIVLKESRSIDDTITNIYIPLIDKLERLENTLSDSRKLTNSWIYFPNKVEQDELRRIHAVDYPIFIETLDSFHSFEIKGIDSLDYLRDMVSDVFSFQSNVMKSLENKDDYGSKLSKAISIYNDDVVPGSEALAIQLDDIINRLYNDSQEMVSKKYASFDTIESGITFFILFAIVIGLVTTFLSSKAIIQPLKKLNRSIEKLSLGDLSHVDIRMSKDEIGDMIESITKLKQGLQETAFFASEIGKGNLDVKFEALSAEDVLGESLLAMRDNLRDVVNETKQVAHEAGVQGRLTASMNDAGKSGAWAELSEAINNLLTSISTPVRVLNEIVNAMAMGDLTQRYTKEAKGEILSLAENLNSALDSLDKLLLRIAGSANTVDQSVSEMLIASDEMTTNTGEIASAIAQMSTGAHTQVTKVDETSSLIEGILESSNNMRERAQTINQGVDNVVTNSVTGEQMLDKVVMNMSEIASYSAKTNDSIKVLTVRSDEISRVLSVITEIASQTNLLALNAAIEAAQAGDAGRGFAVVAEEIRKLAEDSRKSALEIEKLIADVQTDTNEAASIIEVMNKSVKVGEETSQEAVEMFKKIADRARKNLYLSQDILNATLAQEKDIKVVVSNTENVVVIAEQTAAGTEEVASSATELSSGMESYMHKSKRLAEIATDLKSGVSKFKLSDSSN